MVNKVILVGNVGIDPEVRTTESGVKVARVRLATTERIYDRLLGRRSDNMPQGGGSAPQAAAAAPQPKPAQADVPAAADDPDDLPF